LERKVEVIVGKVSGKADIQVITIKGSIDSVTSKEVDEKVLPVIEKGTARIILDLSNVVYMSSLAIMSLVRYSVFASTKKCKIKFVKPPTQVYQTIVVTGVAKHLDTYDSVGSALEKFNSITGIS
jgi:anti-anti-sigma factor